MPVGKSTPSGWTTRYRAFGHAGTEHLLTDDEREVGHLVWFHGDAGAFIGTVVVKEEGRGGGTRLVNEAIALMQERGETKVWLQASFQTEPFWERFGFKSTGRLLGHMEMDLKARRFGWGCGCNIHSRSTAFVSSRGEARVRALRHYLRQHAWSINWNVWDLYTFRAGNWTAQDIETIFAAEAWKRYKTPDGMVWYYQHEEGL